MIINTDTEISVTKMGIKHTSLEYRVATEILVPVQTGYQGDKVIPDTGIQGVSVCYSFYDYRIARAN